MNNRSGIQSCITGAVVLALSALAFAAARQNPQGQFRLSYMPVAQSGKQPTRSLATYSPIKSIDGKTIQLRGDDGVVYIFTLTADTIYCRGGAKVSDWTYLKSVPKKNTVTVLTTDEVNLTALVIWDKEPTISTANGKFDFSLPPMCK
jgi:hypothetical protein